MPVTDPLWIAMIAAAPPTLAVVLVRREQGKKLDEIHVLVNSRLATALDEIAALKSAISAGKVINRLVRKN
jgi:hypothetical protein